ncbi:PECT1 [Symbiodinium necroappetens]|uniref:ethanolamine-phosphate cytidylyltransferase n=1 Tax=Symbiodinium necroappetens TaxID=1628268 RepID=A0A812RFV9_9DINO|nr:PECT1 [Symbiodinium necroappetens]
MLRGHEMCASCIFVASCSGAMFAQGSLQLMAALLKLAPRIFVELPDQPWLQHVYDHFGTARVFLQAATKLTGKQWNFLGPLVMSEWYGRRELWLLEEEPPLAAPILSAPGCLREAVFPCLLPAVGGRTIAAEPAKLEVSDELKFFWHRPSWAAVEEQSADPETVRIFLNGCFDLMHVGHFNALRQAKRLFFQQGYKKVVMLAGIHSDEAITRQKGPPMMSDNERVAVLEATKWVDEFVTHLPYVSMSSQMADALRVRWICHGDDMPICKDGDGMYSDAIEHGRFQMLKRTEGISTTQIIERLLRQQGLGSGCEAEAMETALATTQRLGQFAAPADPEQGVKLLTSAKHVVYVPGIFDLVHPGHVSILQHAAKLGDYLLVGLYSDETVRQHRGTPPVLTMLERAMAVPTSEHTHTDTLDLSFL